MKHLYTINNYCKASIYGIGTYIEQLSSGLLTKNIAVTIVILDSTENSIERKKIDGINYLYFPAIHIPKTEKGLRRYARNISILLSLYVEDSSSIIFQFNYSYHLFLSEAIRYRFPKSRIIHVVHYFSWGNSLLGSAKNLLYIIQKENKNQFEKEIYYDYLHERQFFQSTDILVCLSPSAKDILAKIYQVPEKNIRYIANGLKDAGTKINDSNKRGLKKMLGFDKQDLIILFVGRLNPQKGTNCLIETFKRLVMSLPNAKLVIVGGAGQNLQQYQNMIYGYWKNIYVTGFLDKNKLLDFYQIADVGILLSLHEQCSYVAIEMMMYGIPIIGTNAMGLTEMIPTICQIPIQDVRNNLTSNSSILEKKIIEVVNNRYYYSQLCRRKYEEKYNLEMMIKQYMEVYHMRGA